MLTGMRTTLVLDDNLARQAKRRAAERNMTFSDVVNEALRESFRRPPPPARQFRLVTFRSSGAEHHAPEDLKRVLEEQDRERLG
jgi:hypothetical protein